MIRLIEKLKNRLNYYKRLVAQYSAEDTVFIYQMGKIGSTTLEHSLPNAVHIHAFYFKNHTCPVRLFGLRKFSFVHGLHIIEQTLLWWYIRRVFKQRRKQGKKTKIITLVREPLERNQSMFFHDLDAYLYAAHTNCMNTRSKPISTRSQPSSMLVDVFNEEFDHDYPLNWFDNEFYVMTGINIFDYAFDKVQGSMLINKEGVDILCLRSDKLSDNVQQLSDFVGKSVEIESMNKAEEKWYGELYKQFKMNYVTPNSIVNKIQNSQFYQHFFE